MKAIKKTIKSSSGYIFIEVLISMIIISMLLLTFISMFVIAARFNRDSKDIIDSTYTAQNMMEELYNLSISNTLESTVDDLKNNILSNSSYELTADQEIIKGQYEGLYMMITLKELEENDLTFALVEVYSDDTYTHQDAVMQSTFLWYTDDTKEPDNPDDPTEPDDPDEDLKIDELYIRDVVTHGNRKSFFVQFILNNNEIHIHVDRLTVEVNQPREYYYDGIITTSDGSIIDYRLNITITSNGNIVPSIDSQQTR